MDDTRSGKLDTSLGIYRFYILNINIGMFVTQLYLESIEYSYNDVVLHRLHVLIFY